MVQRIDMDDRARLLAEVIRRELSMFLMVPADGTYACQQDPDGFRLHRSVQFSIWSEETLASYFNDLRRAEKDGINLMTIKYARMENRIPRKNLNPLIDTIATLQIRWQTEMGQKFPALMAASRPVSDMEGSSEGTSFETYLRGELETYSDLTLSLLYRDLAKMEAAGINGSESIYTRLVQTLGYRDLEAAEKSQRRS